MHRVEITSAAAKRIRNHDCWVFREELRRPPEVSAPGEVVEVADHHGRFLAYAFANPRSHIPLRIVGTDRDQPPDQKWLRLRLQEAVTRRRALAPTAGRRLVHSEADRLPGLIVDQYGDYLVVQFRTAGMDRLRETTVDFLRELLEPKGILERSDKEFRDDEGLAPATAVLAGEVPDRIQIEEDGLRFWVDPHRGLKTGFYLDQRPARRRLRQLIRPGQRFLDTFSYTGALGIAAASQGAQVTCIEQHEPFLELAKENARLNGVEDRMEFVAGDAFYWLAAKASGGAAFDWVLMDPPALAKSRTQITKGRQALHHLLVQALGLSRAAGGRLLVCVCTYHLLGLVEEIVRIAAAEEGDRLIVREQWLQAEDHPWLLQVPATRYLTSWLFEHAG